MKGHSDSGACDAVFGGPPTVASCINSTVTLKLKIAYLMAPADLRLRGLDMIDGLEQMWDEPCRVLRGGKVAQVRH